MSSHLDSIISQTKVMSNKALFITEKYLKDTSFINENVSMIKLRPTIIMCQEMHIQTIIGSELYNEIEDQIINNVLTSHNETLLTEFIQPCLSMWVMSESPMIFGFRYMNKNVERGTSENAQMTSMSELQKQIDYFKNKAEWYSERITRHIRANLSLFPAYQRYISIETIRPSRVNYTSGLVIDEWVDCKDFKNNFQGEIGKCCW